MSSKNTSLKVNWRKLNVFSTDGNWGIVYFNRFWASVGGDQAEWSRRPGLVDRGWCVYVCSVGLQVPYDMPYMGAGGFCPGRVKPTIRGPCLALVPMQQYRPARVSLMQSHRFANIMANRASNKIQESYSRVDLQLLGLMWRLYCTM